MEEPLTAAGRYVVVMDRDMAMTMPAPRPWTALNAMTSINPSSGLSPQRPMANDENVKMKTPDTKTFLYPLLIPSFDHRRMKLLSIIV